MIEFKGDCGHTIRARDEDAGKVVRCSYCGREAIVPPREQNDLDALFDEVERTGVYDPQATKVGQKSHRARERSEKKHVPRGKAPAHFDPFAVALKMTYVAVIIIVIVFLYYQVPKLKNVLSWGASATPPPAAPTPVTAAAPQNAPTNYGLIYPTLDRSQSGFYVTSVPSGASIFTADKWDADMKALLDNPTPDPVENKTNRSIRMNSGKYTVAVAIPIDNVKLMKYERYPSVRRKIEQSEESAVSTYFVPDGSKSTTVCMIRDQQYIVRIYDVEVFSKTWTPVTALFLPRALTLEQMLRYLPDRDSYALDKEAVKTELDFQKVPADTDQVYIKDALSKVGKAFYKPPDSGEYLIFQVRIENGTIKTERDY